MKRACAVAALAAFLVVGFCAEAWAQTVALNPGQDYRICLELTSSRGMADCADYYAVKEETMNRAVDMITNGMVIEPGQVELLTTVSAEIMSLNTALADLRTALDSQLSPGEWTDDLQYAFQQETTDLINASSCWANLAYVFTMYFQEVYLLNDAAEDFHEKADALLELAKGLSDDYQEAADALAGDSRNIRALVCDDFFTTRCKASTIQFTLIHMDAQLNIAAITIENNAESFAPLLDGALQIQDTLPQEWRLDLYTQREFDLMMQDHELAMDMFQGCRKLMDDQTLLHDAGEPFIHFTFDKIDNEFRYMEDQVCAY